MIKTLKNLLYILQLEEYNLLRFLKWTKKHKKRRGLERKGHLVWTPKAKVLFLLSLFFNSLLLNKNPVLALQLATLTLAPLENIVKIFLTKLAEIKLKRRKDLTVIGITGSFGKTSTKEILSQILSQKYPVLKTPKSYNTPLGIAQIVLKRLNKKHKVFIVEMGAYKIGEIKAICSFVKPKIGILTGLGPQHLERFGSLENIRKAKLELAYSLPKEGTLLINSDSFPLEKIPQIKKVIFYGIEKKKKRRNYIFAKNIHLRTEKTTFVLETNLSQALDKKRIVTPLLGKHNVLNILPAIALGILFKIPPFQIQNVVKNLSFVSHRLEIIKRGKNIIIDDTYNANPKGVKSAFSLLSLFSPKIKVIITPGLVELGEKQFAENLKVGELAGQTADYVIFVGKTNKEALIRGAEKFKKMEVNLFWVPTLQKAVEKLQELALPETVILFENDLPDQYF